MKLPKSLLTKLVTIGLGATMAFGVGLTASKVAEGVQAATTVTVGNDFSAVSGNIDANFAYTSFKGGAGTAPSVYDGDIRLYQNGGYITVSPRVANYKMTSLTIANSGVSAGKGPFTAWYLLSGNINDTDPSSMTSTGSNSWTSNAYTYSNPSGFTHFKLIATGTSSSTRVYVDYISITYDYFGAGTVDVTGVTISEGASINIYEGSTQQLTAVVAPADATDKTVSWSSNNPTKASVNSSGLVSALSVGSATITVTTTDGGFTDTITVNVLADPFMEALKSTFDGSGNTSWGSTSGMGAYFTSGYGVATAASGGFVKNNASISILAGAPLGSDIKVVVGAVTNSASNTADITVYGLDSLGNRIADLSGTFVTYAQSISTASEGMTAALANPKTVILSTPSDKRVERIEINIASASSRTLLCYVDVYVESYEAATLTSIAITTNPTKTAYYAGEVFNPAGMVVTASYSSGSPKAVSGYTYPTSALVAGTTSIEISYTELEVTKTANVAITVTAIVLNSITIKTATSDTLFTLGEVFTHDGLVINANYNSGTVEVASGFTVSGVDTKVLGSQTATITYEGKTVTYSVDVTNNGASVGTSVTMSDLIISEYIEGSGYNKVIELFNGTGTSVDLSNYKLNQYNNDSATISSTLELSGTIANGDVFIISGNQATQSLQDMADLVTNSTVMGFNGNDAISLSKNDVEIDLVGTIGTSSDFAKDTTLVRKSSISAPTMTYSAGDWDSYSVDTFSYLGAHTTGSGNVTAAEQATAFANYVMTGIGNNAHGNCVAVKSELDTEYGYMHADSKSVFQTSSDSLFVNARARMTYLTNWVAAQSPSGVQSTPDNTSKNALIASAVIGILGLTTVSGFYFLKKKKETF